MEAPGGTAHIGFPVGYTLARTSSLAGAASKLQLEFEGRIMMALVSTTFRSQKMVPDPINPLPSERWWEHLWPGAD